MGRKMISTQDLHATAQLLVARHGARKALDFAVDGLEAMIRSGQKALIPDWTALQAMITDMADGHLREKEITVH
ncbi:MAG TPA: hypothetical protein DCF61_05090 [Alphaproteobacteria bacterium]|jgi:hypothetical protein|nr:hypothetical protein [Alphaproteobacteria bacterium]HAM48698.1 hypothetical protein [Alphaproteobacteria bacterium]